MNRFTVFAIGLVVLACGPEQRSADRSLGGTTLLPSTPGARQTVARVSVKAGEMKVDPCLGDSLDGICAGLADPECDAAHALAGECIAICNGTCINSVSTLLPACQCDAGYPDPCATLQAGGECRGDVVLRCEAGILKAIDCRASQNSACRESELGAGCGAVGNVDLCGVLLEGPACEGNVWVRCNSGQVLRTDCTEQGLLCGWDAEKEGFGCQKEEAE